MKSKLFKLLIVLTVPFFILENIIKSFSFQYMYDQVIDGNNLSLSQILSLFFTVVLILILVYICGCIYECLKTYFIEDKIKKIRIQLLDTLLKDYHETKKQSSSHYLNTFSNDLTMIEDNYYFAFVELLENIGIFLCSSISILLISPLMFLCVLLSFFPVFIIPKMMGKLLNKKTLTYSEKNSMMLKKISEFMEGIDVIHQYRIRKQINHKAHTVFHDVFQSLTNLKGFQLLSSYLIGCFGNITFILIIVVGLYLYSKQSLTIGQLTAIMQLSNTVLSPVSRIANEINQIKSVKEIKHNIDTLRNKQVKQHRFSSNRQGIQVQNLCFNFNEKQLFNNFNLSIQENEHISLQGENGSGKSTLCKIIANRIDDYTGDVQVNYDDLIYLDQNSFIFDESILYNITLGSSYTDKQLQDMIQQCELTQLIQTKGLDYVCGVNGANLSGGEKQKIVLARALLQDKKIYILDESMSAVDQESRTLIEQRLFSDKNKTLIYISHFSCDAIKHLLDRTIVLESH